ncbi:MAG: LLM class flavin-dependent oxidoreductase [Chloroflexi bacterium]|nr:LLM class flavin-dependent oxidoreductase [Chloroflexota bacterium]
MGQRDLGILIPTRQAVLASFERPPLDECWQLAQAADQNGLSSVWVGDSITAKPRLEALTTLAYLAALTQNVRLGTAVLLPFLRQPVALAHSLFNIDQISKGRLIVGVGVGASGPGNVAEAEALGTSVKVRARRTEDALTVMRELAAGKPVTREGKGYRLNEITVGPLPYQKPTPPVWITAGNSGKILPEQVDRVARFGDGIIATQVTPEVVRQVREELGPALAAKGRDLATMDFSVYCTVRLDDDRARAQQAIDDFVKAYYGFQVKERGAAVGPAEEAIKVITGFWDAGANHVIVRFAGNDQMAQTERFIREVWSQLARS